MSKHATGQAPQAGSGMGKQTIVPLATAGALVAGAVMGALSLAAKAGFYGGAAKMMIQWHAFYDLTIGGIIAGMIEAATITFVVVFTFAWTNSKLQEKMA